MGVMATRAVLAVAGVVLLASLQAFAQAPSEGGGTWTFEVRPDPFGDGALLDLRGLNEETAGEKGWMVARDGKLFIPGSDRPFRGWSAGLRPFGCSYEMGELAYTARLYAKLGINQVREMSDANASVLPAAGSADITKINPEGLAKLHRLVAAMKAEGVYVTYCPWWHLEVRNSPQLPGFASAKAFYWCEDLQELAKGWYRQILTAENPYTGVPLAESGSILIQAVTESHLTGWKTEPAARGMKVTVGAGAQAKETALPAGASHILNVGKQPFEIQRVRAGVIFRDGKPRKATAADLYGYARQEPVRTDATDRGLRITLPEDTYYTIVR